MKTKHVLTLFELWILSSAFTTAAPLGTAITYQGQLAERGAPANGRYDLQFTLYEDAPGGAQWVVTNSAVIVSNGLFTTLVDFGADPYDGAALWLEIAVAPADSGTFTILSPRQRISPSPYALYAPHAGAAVTATSADSVATDAVTGDTIADGTITEADLSPAMTSNTFWRLGGNAGTSAGTQFLGTTDSQQLELKVNNRRGLRLEHATAGSYESVNVIGGWQENHIANYTVGATIAGGGGPGYPNLIERSADYSVIGGGRSNVLEGDVTHATVGGGFANRITDDSHYGAIGGGQGNVATRDYSTIGGGRENSATGVNTVVGGGSSNRAEGSGATVGGGGDNRATSYYTTVAGGTGNLASGNQSTVGGGDRNEARGLGSTVSGGVGNRATGLYASGAGGYGNVATNEYAAVSGGLNNTAGGIQATVGGGGDNWATGAASTVAGGCGNEASAPGAVVGGGGVEYSPNAVMPNRAQAPASTIGGGLANTIQTNASYATVGGGVGNYILTNSGGSTISGGGGHLIQADTLWATIGGGFANSIQTNAGCATVSGGRDNEVQTGGEFATIGGGSNNVVKGMSPSYQSSFATIAGGLANTIWEDSDAATIAGGRNNTVVWGDNATIAGGQGNRIMFPFAAIGGGVNNWIDTNGIAATIPGGASNYVNGRFSFAAGRRAKANNDGAFVWGDSKDHDIVAHNPDEFVARATGGFFLFTAIDGTGYPTTGAVLASGAGSWAGFSDRNGKENFRPVDARAVLDKVVALPVTEWNWKSQDASVRHVGPVAQDFHSAFGLGGHDDRHITSSDADGVALVAIQGLNQRLENLVKQKDVEISQLKRELGDLRQLVHSLIKTYSGGGP